MTDVCIGGDELIFVGNPDFEVRLTTLVGNRDILLGISDLVNGRDASVGTSVLVDTRLTADCGSPENPDVDVVLSVPLRGSCDIDVGRSVLADSLVVGVDVSVFRDIRDPRVGISVFLLTFVKDVGLILFEDNQNI